MWLLAALLLLSSPVHAARIKDVASLYGVRANPLVGYGLVVGLNRTGDSTQNVAAVSNLANRLQGLGITMSDADIKSKNIAMVMVTSQLPSGSRPGSHLDVNVSSVGDAKSLEGGILLLTPLYAANGAMIASAQGPITVGGYTVGTGRDAVTHNHPTVGFVPSGATVEVEVPNGLNIPETTELQWLLARPDFSSASAMAASINKALDGDFARARDGGTVLVTVPDAWLGRQAELIARIEGIDFALDSPNRVVVDERTGTIVMGANITISPVAVAHGGLTIEVQEDKEVSQPGALSNGQTTTVDNTRVHADEEHGKLTLLNGVTVGDVVSALNAMGVTPRDLIVILQAMRSAGGLHADIETL
jgi:flagellar P-ring protein precursor FlgI